MTWAQVGFGVLPQEFLNIRHLVNTLYLLFIFGESAWKNGHCCAINWLWLWHNQLIETFLRWGSGQSVADVLLLTEYHSIRESFASVLNLFEPFSSELRVITQHGLNIERQKYYVLFLFVGDYKLSMPFWGWSKLHLSIHAHGAELPFWKWTPQTINYGRVRTEAWDARSNPCFVWAKWYEKGPKNFMNLILF